MTELEFEQRVREYYSKYTGKMPNWEEYQKLKSAALKYNFDLDEIWKKLQENEKILKDVIQNRNVEDLITDELSEGFIEQYIAKGICSNYILHLKSEKNRGKDTINQSSNFVRNCGIEAMVDGIKLFIKKIESGDQVNSYYLNKVKNVGLPKIKAYIDNFEFKNSGDPALDDLIEEIYLRCYQYTNEHEMTKSSLSLFFNEDNLSVFRFYINMPTNESSALFIRDYIILCQNYGIFYDIKPYFNNGEHKDVTIIYSTIKDYKIKLNIMEQLLIKYPNIELGTPPFGTVNMNDIGVCHNINNIGICHIGVPRKMTYNMYIAKLFKDAIDLFVIERIPDLSLESKKNLMLYKEGDSRDNIIFYPYLKISEDDMKKSRELLKLYIASPLKRKITIDAVIQNVKKLHNLYQGFPVDLKSNVALDSWYVYEQINKQMLMDNEQIKITK